jgi:hypothetical protein
MDAPPETAPARLMAHRSIPRYCRDNALGHRNLHNCVDETGVMGTS